MNRKARMGKSAHPDVETLQSDPAFHLVYELGFQDMVPFVLTQIKRRGIFSWLYAAVNLAMLAFIILFSLKGLLDHSLGWKSLLFQTVLGAVAGSILVIPFHELIHGLTYRILGARKIIFGADLKQFIFFVTANRHPVSGSEVYLLALSPFVIINLVSVAATITLSPRWALCTGAFLLCHNIMCIGDFAISNFVSKASGRVYTYDEPENKMSYFFEEL